MARARPAGSFLRRLNKNRGCSPRATGIPTTRAFYSGGSVSLRVNHSKCGLLSSFIIQSVRLSPLWPSLARAPRPGSSRPTVPPKGYLPSRQRSSWFPSTRLLDSSNHGTGAHVLTSNHAQTESDHLTNWSHPQWL